MVEEGGSKKIGAAPVSALSPLSAAGAIRRSRKDAPAEKNRPPVVIENLRKLIVGLSGPTQGFLPRGG